MIEQTAKILFVDDEKFILHTIKALLADEDWSCYFATSAKEALALLEKENIDLVVADLCMPDINGVDLLAKIRQCHPQIIRIFLTAYAKDETTTKALSEGNAQQVIPKPWIDQELKEIIRSAIRQSAQQKKHSLKFQQLINSMPLLPALPESYTQVQSCIMDDEIDIEKMANIIGQDVALSGLLLHWANSALFGQRFRVDTLKKAIVVLGTDVVKSLILSEAVTRSMTTANPMVEGFDLSIFKKHSIATAIISRLLIKSQYSLDADLQDRAFIAGLLHDLGQLLAANHFSAEFASAINEATNSRCSLISAESKIMGTTHAELGSFLAEWWALPHFIVAAIKLHHSPKASPVEPEVVNAVYLANLLTYRFDYGGNGEVAEPELSKEIWDRFFLNEEGLEILQAETDKILQSVMV